MRQVPQPCASGMEHGPQGLCFMAAEIVEDGDVSLPQDGQEQLLDIGAEALAVDRTVEDAGCGEPVPAERAEEGQGSPSSLRGEAAQALTLWGPSAQGDHIGLDPGFVDEDQTARIEPALQGLPASPPTGHVGTGLLKSEQRFF